MKQFSVNLCNGFYCSRNVNSDGMVYINRTKQIEEHTPGRRILIHFDFLTDDALLLLNRFLRKVGFLNKVQ